MCVEVVYRVRYTGVVKIEAQRSQYEYAAALDKQK